VGGDRRQWQGADVEGRGAGVSGAPTRVGWPEVGGGPDVGGGGSVGWRGGTYRAVAASGARAGVGGVPMRAGRLEVGGGARRRWQRRVVWWRRKLFEMKWWACGDCWACGENLRLRYKTACSSVTPGTFIS
jgi:hypothetical protein